MRSDSPVLLRVALQSQRFIITAVPDEVACCRVVFDTLYLLLSFGHESAEEAERLDPPFSYFRIRLVCSLLETCGQFFNKGLAKKRLDRFLAFYQRYLLAKPPLPLDVEFDVQVSPHTHCSMTRFTLLELARQLWAQYSMLHAACNCQSAA